MSQQLREAWTKTVRRCGPQRAIIQGDNGETVTFAQLEERAAEWAARHMREPRALAGRAVVFSAPNGIGWFEIFLGLLRNAAVVVPLDAAEPPAAQMRLAKSLRAAFCWEGGKLIALDQARRFRDPGICLVKLTSGSTGEPRPLAFTGAQLLADGKQVTSTMGIGRRDLNYALIPLGHSYGLGNLTVPLIAQGIPLLCGSAPLPHAIAADFARWNPTVFPGVPAIWRALAASTVVLGSLRLGISAGAPLPSDVARDFAAKFGRPLHNFYGSSETGGIAYDATGRATLNGGVGRALRGVMIESRAGQRLRVCSTAVTTAGNRNRRGHAGCWLMQDRVALDARGELTLLGRRGTVVKIAGRRVNLTEVIAVLRRLGGVRDAWAGVSAGVEPTLGAVLATERTPTELRAELLAGTAAWKIPKKILVVTALPLTARGKTDVRTLHAMAFGPARA